MAKRVLDIGNCSPDHASITHMIESSFGAQVDKADGFDDALPQIQQNDYDLVLVNRLLDRDGSSGLEVLKQVHEQTGGPVMLITNFPEHQETAVAAGAVPGFGKNSIGQPDTIQLLATYLQSD